MPSTASRPDPRSVTTICHDAVSTVLPDSSCVDVVAAVLGRLEPQADVPTRFEIGPCPSGGCQGDPESLVVADVMFRGGSAASFVVGSTATRALIVIESSTIDPSDLPSPEPFEPPSVGSIGLDGAPLEIGDRIPHPLCGIESAGLAGPFALDVRSCFLGAVYAMSPAEFGSTRSDVEGDRFFELWRFDGVGPIHVFLESGEGWSQLTCALLIVRGDQAFDHTDCEEREVT